MKASVAPALVRAWLWGRSIARGIGPPVVDHGGFRVDSDTDAEISRWVFPAMTAGLRDLAESIEQPRYFLKLCGEAEELRSILPSRWRIHAPNFFMQAGHAPPARPLAEGYRMEVRRNGAVGEGRIWSEQGELAASGFAAETVDAFVYDRIVTSPDHRRKGLGGAVMAGLRAIRTDAAGPELLVATDEGRALYAALGWRTISPYSSASIMPA